MKILMVNAYALPPTEPGGTRHYSLAKGLMARGHQVTVVASGFFHDKREDRLLPEELYRREVLGGVPFLWLKTPGYQGNGAARLWDMLAFARAVKHHAVPPGAARPDVIIGSTPQPFAAQAAMNLAKRLGVPFVLEIRDVWPQSLIDVMGVPKHHPIIWILSHLERELYQGADHIVTLLPNVAARVEQQGGDPSAITWVSNGIDLELVPRPTPPPERDTFTVMFPGTLCVSNALDVMIDAAVLLQARAAALPKQLDLVVMGTGPELPRIRARAQAEGLRNFRFLPPVPKCEVYDILAQADAFWSCSRRTSLWEHGISFNKLYDFMAMARPTVIGLDAPNNPILESRSGITVEPEDPLALADGIEALMNLGAEERWAMGLRGRADVEARFSTTSLAASLENALRTACSTHPWRAHAS